MTKEQLNNLLELISQLKPHEWRHLKSYVDKKYFSKQSNVPMPSMEELKDYGVFDFPTLEKEWLNGKRTKYQSWWSANKNFIEHRGYI